MKGTQITGPRACVVVTELRQMTKKGRDKVDRLIIFLRGRSTGPRPSYLNFSPHDLR